MEKSVSGVDFHLPSKSAASGYLVMVYQLCLQLGGIVATVQSYTDPRPRLQTELIISVIPDEEAREKARKFLLDKIDAIMKNPALGNEQKGTLVTSACLETVGHCWSWWDEMLAIESKLTIGEIGEAFTVEESGIE